MTELVVVGGGIVGASTCYYAKQMGASCTLIERDGVASHASGFAFGGLHPRVIASTESDMPRFASESFEEHRRLHEHLDSDRAKRSTWRLRSSVSLAWNEFDANLLKTQASAAFSTSQWIDAHDLQKLESRISHEALGGLLISDSAEVDSAALTESLFQIASPNFHLDEIVEVELAGDHIRSVSTRRGESISGDAFVFAMGPWSSRSFDWFGVSCAVKPLKGQILRLRIDGPTFQHSFSTNGNYMSTKPDGLLWIGTTEEDVGFDESTTVEGRRAIMNVLRHMLPESQTVEVANQTACLRPMSLDGELIMGRIPGVSNALVGTGGGRKGVLYGPAMGKYLTNLALSTSETKLWTSLSPDRYLNAS